MGHLPFSTEDFARGDISLDSKIIHPAIDPLTVKNKDIGDSTTDKYLKKYDLKTDKPIITQISRFDKWKDPEGVVDVFDKVKEEVDSRLVLLGAPAIDDPEGPKIYKRLIEKVKGRDDVIVINKESDILVNVLQRVSSVVLQKSLGEGFGLTVTEALWKGAAVVASDVGGIPLQIVDEETGFLVDPNDHEQVAEKIIRILEDPELRAKLGGSAYNQVEEHFLIIHQLLDWIKVLKEVLF